MSYQIGQLAAMSGCRVVTIRYYEKRGLLGSPNRSTGNFRLYEDQDLRRLKFICLCRENGIPLKDVKVLVALMTLESISPEPASTFLDYRLASIEAQIERLTRLRICLEHLKSSRGQRSPGKSLHHEFQEAASEFCEYCRAEFQRKQSESTTELGQ